MNARSARRLPYPGLRSFERDETDLFFGRAGCVNDMIRRLGASRFLAVLGASGSGKSSLVRTGLLDGLELGLLAEAGSWWRIVEIRPGADPIGALARGLAGGQGAADADVERMRALLLEGPRSITAWCRGGNLAEGENLLILVDQFEELFRFQHYEGQQQAQAFVGLLVESAQNRDAPVYVTLTMRSEFLSACSLFAGLAEAMNEGQYLTPRMNREQCREAIEGPAAVCGFSIEPALVNRLLNDLSDFAPWDDRIDQASLSQLDRMVRRADQLPLLQHALNRLWVRAGESAADIVLKLEDYERLGGLRGALDQHADEIMKRLGKAREHVVEQVFRALTTGASIADAVRRPTRLDELVAITGASREDVAAVCNAFRAQGCNFLTPYEPAPLRPETIIDISHESLIRQWSRLAKWVDTEASDVESLRRLNSAAVAAEKESGDLLHGRELSRLAGWREDAKITDAWAKRYVNNPERAFAFLARSKEAERRNRRGQNLVRAAFGVLGAIVLLAAAVTWVQYRNQEELTIARDEADRARAAAESAAEKAAEAAARAEEARAEADRERIEAEQQRAKAEAAAAALDANLYDTRDTIWEYVGGFVDNLQRGGELTRSADLLASLAAASGQADNLPPRVVDRLAWQTMAVNAGLVQAEMAGSGSLMKRLGSGGLAPLFALWRGRDGEGTISVVDRRNGQSVSVFAFDESILGALRKDGDHFLSLDGRHALLVGDDGRLFRWSAGDRSARRVFDRRWLAPKNAAEKIEASEGGGGRSIKEAVFAADASEIAIVYREFDTNFLTIVPLTGAWRSQSWPLYEIQREIEQALKIELDPYSNELPFDVLGIDGGDIVLGAMWADDDGDTNRGLFRFNLATKAVAWLAGPVSATALRTADPGILRVDSWVSAETCRQGAANVQAVLSGQQAEQEPEDIYGFRCLADLDLATGKLRGDTYLVPYLATWQPDATPLPTGRTAITMTADRLPGWIATTSQAADSGTAGADLAVLGHWLRSGEFDFPIDSGGLDAVFAGRGAILARTELRESDSDESTISLTHIPDPGSAPAVFGRRTEWTSYRFKQPLRDLTVDGSGTMALGFDGQSWFAAELGDQGSKEPGLEKLTATVSPTCGEHIKGTRQQDDSKLETRAVVALEPSERRFHLRPIHSSKAVFAAVLPDRSVAVVGVTPKTEPSVERQVRIWCPAKLLADSISAIDIDLGVVALLDAAAGKFYVLDGGNAAETAPTVAAASLPNGESLRGAAFAGNGKLIVLSNAERLFRYDTARLSDGPQELTLFLPAADRVAARGNSILLLRDEQGTDAARWTSAAIVEYSDDAQNVSASYVGFLPITMDAETAILLGHERGKIGVVTRGLLLSFDVPRNPSAGELARAVATSANPASLEGSAEASLVRLGANAIGRLEMSAQPEDAPDFGCASSVERALHMRGIGSNGAEHALAEAKADCAQDPSPTNAAILELLSIGIYDTASLAYEWPVPASKLVQLAAAGDGVALGALTVWGREKDQTTLLGSAMALLVEDFGAGERTEGMRPVSETFLGYAQANAEASDPYLHRTIAYAAELSREGDRTANIATAVRHYWIAERLFDAGGNEQQAADMAQRRTGLANELAAPVRAAVASEVLSWEPKPFSVAPLADPSPELDERLAADLLELDKLALRTGHAVAIDLIKLHLLSLRLELAETEPARAGIREHIARISLGRSDAWPSIDLTSANELLRLFASLAAPESALADATRLRLRLATIGLIERSAAPIDLSVYEVAEAYLSALEDAASRTPEALSAVAADFRFGTRVFDASSLRADDDSVVRRTDRILSARMRLASLLDGRPDARIAGDVTKFWLAWFLIERPEDYTPDKVAKQNKLLGEALAGLEVLPTMDAPELDDLAVLAVAATWISELHAMDSADDMPSPLLAAIKASDILDDAVETGRWTPVWREDSVVTHTLLLDWMTKPGSLDNGMEPPFGAHVPQYVERRMSAFRYYAMWQRLLVRGGSSKAAEEALDNQRSNRPVYAAAGLAARQRYVDAAVIPGQTECDRLASSLIDPDRRAPGLDPRAVNLVPAMEACEAAHEATPEDPVTLYQLARVTDFSEGDKRTVTDLLVASAGHGYAAAFNNLSVLFEEADEALSRRLHDAYAQRVFRDHFADFHAALKTVATSDSDKESLRVLAEQAARVGSPDASRTLAEMATDPAERKFRLLVAKQQFANGGNSEQTEAVDDLINDIRLPEEDDRLATAKARAWTEEPSIDMDEDLRRQILERDGVGG